MINLDPKASENIKVGDGSINSSIAVSEKEGDNSLIAMMDKSNEINRENRINLNLITSLSNTVNFEEEDDEIHTCRISKSSSKSLSSNTTPLTQK